MDAFDEIYPRTGIREDQALSMFLSGLIDELQMSVRMFKPKGLAEAISLAKLQEMTVRALGGKAKESSGGGSSGNAGYSYSKSLAVTTTPSKPGGFSGNTGGKDNKLVGGRPRLTPGEMDEKRKKGLCYWCPEKFTPAHVCSRHKSFVMQLLEEEERNGGKEGEEELQFEECEEELDTDELQLSLHAMWRTHGPQIMRIKGKSQGKPLRILVDTGSTHNFLSKRMIPRLQCATVEVPPKAVEVANGQMLQCTKKCTNFVWAMQGTTFATEVFIIGLETYDLILGVHWLSTLGRIAWDFGEMSMEFIMDGVAIRLVGEKGAAVKGQLHCLHVWDEPFTGDGETKMSTLMATGDIEPMQC